MHRSGIYAAARIFCAVVVIAVAVHHAAAILLALVCSFAQFHSAAVIRANLRAIRPDVSAEDRGRRVGVVNFHSTLRTLDSRERAYPKNPIDKRSRSLVCCLSIGVRIASRIPNEKEIQACEIYVLSLRLLSVLGSPSV